jgi:hypothetical protein
LLDVCGVLKLKPLKVELLPLPNPPNDALGEPLPISDVPFVGGKLCAVAPNEVDCDWAPKGWNTGAGVGLAWDGCCPKPNEGAGEAEIVEPIRALPPGRRGLAFLILHIYSC